MRVLAWLAASFMCLMPTVAEAAVVDLTFSSSVASYAAFPDDTTFSAALPLGGQVSGSLRFEASFPTYLVPATGTVNVAGVKYSVNEASSNGFLVSNDQTSLFGYFNLIGPPFQAFDRVTDRGRSRCCWGCPIPIRSGR